MQRNKNGLKWSENAQDIAKTVSSGKKERTFLQKGQRLSVGCGCEWWPAMASDGDPGRAMWGIGTHADHTGQDRRRGELIGATSRSRGGSTAMACVARRLSAGGCSGEPL